MGIASLFRRRRHVIELEQVLKARPKVVWQRLMDVGWLDGEAKWGPQGDFILWDGTRIKVHAWEPPHRLGFFWIPQVGDRTIVELNLSLLPHGHTTLRLHHKGITSDEQTRRFRTRWGDVLRSLSQSR